MNSSSSESDFQPTASLPILRLRSEMLDWVRQFFRQHGYWEVETPMLSHDVCVDAWLEPFRVDGSPDSGDSPMYLQTSPEFGMKRLLAVGADAIFQMTRAFRQEESGRLHNPEFTIIEWYRVGETYHQQMDFVEQFTHEFSEHVMAVAEAIEGLDLSVRGSAGSATRRLSRPYGRMAYDEAFQHALGNRVLSASVADIQGMAKASSVEVPDSLHEDDRDGWLNLLLSETVEPMLAEQGAVFLYDYPASQAALARIRNDDTPVAERFEIYIDGVEICNGYQELTDPDELRRRQSVQAQKRQREGLPRLPEYSRLLEAMEGGLPECSGVALGFDRLLLTAVGLTSLAEVTAFPFDRA